MFDELYGDIGAEVPGHADFADDASVADLSEIYDFAPDPKDDGSGGSRLSMDGSLSQTSSRRRRGRRGSGQQQPKKWRSGHIPAPPSFSGDIENDPFCLRHYSRALRRWVTITKEYLPPNEQALRALDALSGDAALEFEEIDDDRYNTPTGIETLLQDLGVSFGEKEIFRKGGLIREFESMVRVQGESVTAFVRRFRLMERKLQDAKIPQYPSETRAVKLLDGLRLDERATSQLLLAAGNRYDFQALVDAIRVQCPAGLTLTGLARSGMSLSGFSKSTSSSVSSRSRGRASSVSSFRGRGTSKGGSAKWRTWHTDVDAIDEGGEEQHENYVTANEDAADEQWYEDEDEFEYQYDEEEDNQQDDAEPGASHAAGSAEDGAHDLPDDHQALTATSKRLAAATQSRGYYNVNAKGKSSKGTSPGKGKSKDKGSGKKTVSFQTNSSGKSGGNPNSKGKSKGSKGSSKGFGSQLTPVQKQRLDASQCIGCGASDHWLRDCPHMTSHQAHICGAATTLDGDGMVVWMVNHDEMTVEPDAEPPELRSPTQSELDAMRACYSPPSGSEDGNPDDFMDARMADELLSDEYRGIVDSSSVGFHQDINSVAVQTDQTCVVSVAVQTDVIGSPSFPGLFPGTWTQRPISLCASSDAGDLNPDDVAEQVAVQELALDLLMPDWNDPDIQRALAVAEWGEDPRTSRMNQRGEDPSTSRTNQNWGEDPRTSRTNQQWGEDPRTSRTEQEPKSQEPQGHQSVEKFVDSVGSVVVGSVGTLASQAPGASSSSNMSMEVSANDCPLHQHERDDRQQFPHDRHVHQHGRDGRHWTQHGRHGRRVWRRKSGDAGDGTGENSVLTVSSSSSTCEPPEFSVAEAPLLRTPQLLVQYSDEPCLVIVDTGCQRQVAGKAWHESHVRHLDLPRVAFKEKCQFRFGPSMSSSSTQRFAYPSGLGNHFVVMFFSCVDADAPALMSRQALTTLDAVPDISGGQIHYRALNVSSPLYLSSCGHLLVRLDEWPSKMPKWPCDMDINTEHLPDVWAPSAVPVRAQELPGAKHPANSPPNATLTSFMAAEMAPCDEPAADLHRSGAQVSAAVCGNQPEAQCERWNSSSFHASLNGDNNAVNNGCDDGSVFFEPRQIPDDTRELSPSKRSPSLRSSRALNQDMRPLRVSSNSEGWTAQANSTQGITSCKDTAGRSKSQRESKSQKSYGHLRTIVFWLGTLLAFISGLLLGTTSVSELDLDSRAAAGNGEPDSAALDADYVKGITNLADESGRRMDMATGSTSHGDLGAGGLSLGEPRLCGGSGGGLGTDLRRRGNGHMRLRPSLFGSADEPLTYEDRGFSLMKPGKQKRLLGSVRALRHVWMVEHSIYNNIVHCNRKLRRHKVDLVEIYGGHANVTARALECGLRALQPIDKIHGINLQTKKDHQWLRSMLRQWSPFLTLIEPECRLWSPLTNLNYHWRPEELAQLRQDAQMTIEEIAKLVEDTIQDERYFLLENPHLGALWDQPAMQRLQQRHNLCFDFGHMCCYGLRGKQGRLIKKPTGWLSNHPVHASQECHEEMSR